MEDKIETYLGDGLYAEWSGYDLILYASNGEKRTNTVYLDQEVLANLLVWLKKFIVKES